MSLVKGYEFVIRNSKGKIYNFYLNEKEQMEYIVTNEKNQWAKKNIVLDEAVSSYSVEIDNYDKIHIVSYDKTKKIHYSILENNKWINFKLLNYANEDCRIYYPVVKCINKRVHIFYYLQFNKEKGKCSLLHLTKKDNQWTNDHVLNVTYDKLINPFKIICYKNQFHVLFTSLLNDYSQIFLSTYDHCVSHWGQPIKLTDTPIEKLYLDCLMTTDNALHITWSSYDERALTVQYIKHDFKNDVKIYQPLAMSEKSNCSFPIVILHGNVLWSTWLQMNKLFSCYSVDGGITWSSPVLCKDSQTINFKRYIFRSNYKTDHENMLCSFLYGTLYPKIQFIGFGGDLNDEIPSSES